MRARVHELWVWGVACKTMKKEQGKGKSKVREGGHEGQMRRMSRGKGGDRDPEWYM